MMFTTRVRATLDVVGGLENVFQFFRGVSERDLYIMLLLFAFLVFRPGGVFARPVGRE